MFYQPGSGLEEGIYKYFRCNIYESNLIRTIFP